MWSESVENLGQDSSADVKTEILCIVGPGAAVQVEHKVVLALTPGWQPFQSENHDFRLLLLVVVIKCFSENLPPGEPFL